ncbi:S-adenosyl methyltransferase [Streptoalloteichus tenebrarius]|uniref:S-adenosyl methyltransferase n=1 Tax=Streptoalloteichus tenebrarius (strain ATCC 17920 / DSM 40477 / JCM 4838 / CBS 697.72 / NBRC 16177 / NCIMB 11028 / NRRL B-12390 / A12253. 1 / ISP 5477) TaxID=1933 RepID=A0ABT1HUG4_STRSD|nr:SAM-dependent methyltransferase [Streptoalloteichus tenebrarius]MCP2259168.1 S-adenosyl methyltransferase [Streptoalloteichus tenebrarius]BFF04355.1 SAM-dependent methyltransferase [Streptoalloteichus tenebrarius]
MDQSDQTTDSVGIERVDKELPSAARMYDYYLGGTHNFASDRRAAEQAIAAMPATVLGARANRAFLRRAVQFLVDAGVRQFLDLGSGIPTVGNVHEVAHRVAPDARVVYVDVDPVAVAHSRGLLADEPNAAAVRADLRDVDRVLGHPEVARLLDLDQPVGLLMVAVLHFVPLSDDAAGIVARYRDALAPGSHLALSHMSLTGQAPEVLERFQAVYANADNQVVLRSREELLDLFTGFDLVEPGLVPLAAWRPDTETSPELLRLPGFAGVGRRR